MRDYEGSVKSLRENAEWADGNIWEVPIMLPDNLRQAADAIEELVSNADKFKWISTAERQPEKTGLYLCYTKKRVYLVLNYSKRHNMWNAFDSEDEPKHALEVTHWMHLPEPPEVMEAKHGRWIEEDGYQICSECGEEHHWIGYRASYCDVCGAKMDGGVNDGRD